MDKQSLTEFMRKWGISGRINKIETDYTEGEVTFRKGKFELQLDGASFKADIHWRATKPEPSLSELLADVRGMALATDNAKDFEAWAKDLEYDTDSIKAENRYYAHERKARELERWLGTGRYRELLWQTKGK